MASSTDISDYAEFLEVTAPDIVEQFNRGYEDPAYDDNVCLRCSAVVKNQSRHNDYHRALSLVVYAMGTTMHSIVNLAKTDERNEDGG